MDAKIEKLVKLTKSTNAVASEIAKKELAKMGLDESGNPIGGKEEAKKEAKEEAKEEKKSEAKEKKKKVKKDGTPDRTFGKVSKIDVAVDKQTVTYKGKTYTLDECEDLFKAWNMKKKAARKATEKSEAKSVTEKVLDKAETTIKQVLTDKAAKKKIQDDPKTAKKELGQIEMNMRRFLQSVEKFLGKRIPESKVKRIFAFFDEIELMEMGGALTYADVYEGRSAEFAKGGKMGKYLVYYDIYDEYTGKTLDIEAHSLEEAEEIASMIEFDNFNDGDEIPYGELN